MRNKKALVNTEILSSGRKNSSDRTMDFQVVESPGSRGRQKEKDLLAQLIRAEVNFDTFLQNLKKIEGPAKNKMRDF